MLTKASAAKALKKRKLHVPTPIILRDDFPQQNAFINDTSRFIAAQCSRRSGKTNGLALRFFKTMERYPKSQCLYIALTFESAKDILMPVLKELNDIHKIGCTFTEAEMRHPNGAKLKIVGADMKNFIKRLRGRKYPAVAIDEAQDFGSHLDSLIYDVLTPSISDYVDGWIAITGTPGPVPSGTFFEITKEAKYGYSLHGWTLLENPYMPGPQAFLDDIKTKRQWDDNNPTYLREYKNQWVLDVESLWIRYKEKLNHYDTLPTAKWHYIFGIDIGYNDADAIAVLAWSEASPDVYLVEECLNRKQGLTELVEQIQALSKKYNPDKMVIDAGGLGKKLAEEIRRRHHIPVHDADKIRKQENVEILNDNLRLGKFKAKSSSRFAQDSYLVQIDWDKTTPDRIVIKKKPHSDIIDAVLYAFKESPAFTYQAPPPKPVPGTPEWAKAEHDAMWQATVDRVAKENEYKNDPHDPRNW